MRIKRGQHPIDGRLNQLLIRNLFNIITSDPLKHITEQGELAIGFVII